ncbi:DUF5054 domain-containing protein [Vagococcus sp. PNs007]|uniref:DUF5054 domain-containing protein n=1 Tax=Vagococcus proximus TaxID=2991417 RepID=A0ABT5X253_9ENTE|nr:DUF5054 domain-containing protein [Vagococcus proximus]MDF0480004.1 DUF5054 domain-containing protein [Vagococcus proximus]
MKKLHVVFKTHLDIGFTDLAKNVIDQYLNDFIPRALEIGEALPHNFVWTTGSWLINFYLEHPDVSEQDKLRLANAIKQGTIKWHGLPVTTHTELMDKELFQYGLSISKKLDQTYNKQTIASKLTDVPGHTIGMVPLMAEAGLKYLHIGVNASSAIPTVPELFVWRAKDGSEIVVHYAQDYGETFERAGWEESLYFAHSHDNAGPPKDAEEVTELMKRLKIEHPEKEIVASSLDSFAAYAWEKREELPVIEEEIGDTWIHGIASDPLKISNYQTLLRLRRKWLEEGDLDTQSTEYQSFSEQLMLVAEHTWGGNGNVFLPDYKNYLIDDFNKAREHDKITFNHDRNTMDFGDLMAMISTDIDAKAFESKRSYKQYEASWQEQRDYIKQAVECLSVERQLEASAAIAKVHQEQVSLEDKLEIIPGKNYQFGDLRIAFSTSGGMTVLEDSKHSYILEGKEFGGLSYERFDFSNYSHYISQYSRLTRWTSSWCLVDFAKRGIEAFQTIRYELLKPTTVRSSYVSSEYNTKIVFDLSFTHDEQMSWGLPREIQLSYDINHQTNAITGELKWQGKQANRMPEAYWLETSLAVKNPYRWEMNKMGSWLSPYDVLEKGNRNQHIVSEEGLRYSGVEGSIQLTSHDAPLLSFGRRSMLVFDNKQPSLNEGIFINLANNIWGTNFPAWFEGDMIYRFNATLPKKSS